MAPKENTKTTSPRASSSHLSGAMIKESILSPRFRSAAAMAGWDEEALLLASLVVEDTPVRESRLKRRSNPHLKSPPSTNSNRKRRSRRRSTNLVPPVVLSLDDDDDELSDKKDSGDARKELGTIVAEEEKKPPLEERASPEKLSSNAHPCIDRLREELSCAICLEICFEPTTTPCGHSFCMKCLKYAAAKCGKKCPKCRQLISNGRSCTVNTVLWNTIQLLFPEEVAARKNSTDPKTTSDRNTEAYSESSERSNSTRSSSMRSYTQVSETVDRMGRRSTRPSQSEDAALAYRLQREEFMVAFRSSREEQRNTLYAASANLRSMASRAIHLRTRSRHS